MPPRTPADAHMRFTFASVMESRERGEERGARATNQGRQEGFGESGGRAIAPER